MKKLRESDIERYFIRRVKEEGGDTRKVKWIGRPHAPDRIAFLNGSHWVEIKRPGGFVRLGQVREFFRMKELGAPVWILDTYEAIERWLKGLK